MTAERDQRKQQGDSLYEQYGKPLEEEHEGQYIAITPDGKTVLGEDLLEVAEQAKDEVWPGQLSLPTWAKGCLHHSMNERLESDHFPYLPLKVEVRGRVHQVEALIDTGFTGHVTMPASELANGQPADYEVQATLADESQVSVPAYFAHAQVGQQPSFPIVLLALGDEPSVGLRVTDRFRLILDHGERVIVEP